MKKIILGSLLGLSTLFFAGCGPTAYVQTGADGVRRCVNAQGMVEPDMYCAQPVMYPGYMWYYGGPSFYVPYGVMIHGGFYHPMAGYNYHAYGSSTIINNTNIHNNSTVNSTTRSGGGSQRGIFGSSTSATSNTSTRSFGNSYTAGSASSSTVRGGFGSSASSFSSSSSFGG